MDYLSNLKNIFISESAQRLYVTIPPERADPSFDAAPIKAETAYLRLLLTDMYLARRRVLTQTRYPIVQAYCRFLHDGEKQEINLVAGPQQISGLGQATDRVIGQNYPIFGPVPYAGGDVEIVLALTHMQAADFGQDLVDVLGSLSQLAASAEIQLAGKFLAPVKQVLDSAFGIRKMQAHLVLHNTFSAEENAPNRLHGGYWLVMDVTGGRVDPRTLWVKEGRLQRGPTLEDAQPFEGADYFLFYIQKLSQRDDYSSITSVWKAWKAVIERARQSSDEELDMAFETFRGVVLTSPDFIFTDQSRLITTLQKRVRALRKAPRRSGFLQKNHDITTVMAEEAAALEYAQPVSREELMKVSWRE